MNVPYDPTLEKSLILPDGVEESEYQDILHMIKYHTHVMGKNPSERIGDGVQGKGEGLILLFHGKHTILGEKLVRADC
jgi:hypothetical protein